jgi:hypothetical protein
MSRATDFTSIFACTSFTKRSLATPKDAAWTIVENTDATDDHTAAQAVATTSTIQIAPNKNRAWEERIQFHPSLAVPLTSNSLVLLLEARAREGLAIALCLNHRTDTQHDSKRTPTYEIIFGDAGNTQTTLSSSSGKAMHLRPGRTCQERAWTKYWICFTRGGHVYAGVGNSPGQDCAVLLRNDNDSEQPAAAVCHVGIGNYAGKSSNRQAVAPIKVRNISLTATVPDWLQASLSVLQPLNLKYIQVDDLDNKDAELLAEYDKECKKARERAAKFNVAYKEPEAFLPWSQTRRLRANPEAGFATGIDVSSDAEKAKQKARQERFGTIVEQAESTGNVDAEMNATEQEELPVVQAWDNEAFVKNQRRDPPESLWKYPPVSKTKAEIDDFAMHIVDEPTLQPEKIHIFSIDWAAFKQIRTDDILEHFEVYGPSYVEWLGDLCCNVHFADEYSAARALANLSTELPSPPPSTVRLNSDNENYIPCDFGAMGWRIGKTVLRKIANDKHGRRGTTARLLLRTATSCDILQKRPSVWPKPPPGFSRTRILGPGSDFGFKRGASHNTIVADEATDNGSDEPQGLKSSLRASRSGFSVEELEQERAAKRAKVLDKAF